MKSQSQSRPRYQRKTDRLLGQDVIRDEARCDLAVAPFDRIAREMDRKWGVDRLPSLVPPEMAAKYGAALHSLNEAISANDPKATEANAANCIRGMQAMDVAAIAAGHKTATGDLLAEYDLDGFHFGILPGDGETWPAVRETRSDLQVFTIREVACALKAYAGHVLVQAAKQHFPGAEITAIRPRPEINWNHGDELPGF